MSEPVVGLDGEERCEKHGQLTPCVWCFVWGDGEDGRAERMRQVGSIADAFRTGHRLGYRGAVQDAAVLCGRGRFFSHGEK